MLFWKLPNDKKMAFIPRTGSTAWARAILNKFYSELKDKEDKINLLQGKKLIPQFIIPSEQLPSIINPQIAEISKDQIVAIIRDPIERFRSAFSRLNCETVDEAIAKIKAAKSFKIVNPHIRSVNDTFGETTKLIKWYAYEKDLAALAIDIGLGEVPAKINVSTEEKPSLSRNQVKALREIYAADIKLHEEIMKK
jgi:hypothetical protein